MKETNNKEIIESLERLKLNRDYQYLCTHLNNIKNTVENIIFDEGTPTCEKGIAISRRNSIKAFIELPDDILEQFKI